MIQASSANSKAGVDMELTGAQYRLDGRNLSNLGGSGGASLVVRVPAREPHNSFAVHLPVSGS